MNVLDYAIELVAPRAALKRSQARYMLRAAYDAAASGKRPRGFGSRGGSANTAVGSAQSTVRDRARHMVRNSAHGHAIVDVMVRHVIGSGIVPVWNTGSDRLDNQVSALWDEWSTRSDVEGELSYYGQQELSVRSMIEGGDSVLRFIDVQYREDRRTPCRLQLLEGDQIDASRNGIYENRKVRLGVALGPFQRREGFYLFPEHPGEAMFAPSLTSSFVSAADVRLLYRPLRIGQVRGISWLAPLLLPAKDLADLLQSTIVKAGIEAAFSGFITNEMGGPSVVPETRDPVDGARRMLPEPGMLLDLKPGQDIKFAEPKTSTQFEAVAMHTLQAMAIGAGLTYDQVTGDLRQANYSSLRAGKIEHRRLVEQVQFNHVIPRIGEPVVNRFIDRCIIAGTLRARPEGYPHDWVPPANEPIDPKKDLEADIAAVRSGRMSPQEFIAQWGRDWRKVMKSTKEFWATLDAMGFTLDIDPRKPLAGTGGAAASDGSTENAGADDASDSTAGDAAGNKTSN